MLLPCREKAGAYGMIRRRCKICYSIPGGTCPSKNGPMSDAVTATTLTIRLLGGFRVLIGNDPVPAKAWRLRKAQVLVQMLALAPQHALHREQIMDLLWPDGAPEAAARNLHQVIHAARRALAGPDQATPVGNPLIVRQQVVRLHPEGPLWVDAVAFEEAATRALGSNDPAA